MLDSKNYSNNDQSDNPAYQKGVDRKVELGYDKMMAYDSFHNSGNSQAPIGDQPKEIDFLSFINVFIGIIIAGIGILGFSYLSNLYLETKKNDWLEKAGIESKILTEFANYHIQEAIYNGGVYANFLELSSSPKEFMARIVQMNIEEDFGSFDYTFWLPSWERGASPPQLLAMREAISSKTGVLEKDALEDFAASNLWPLVNQSRSRPGEIFLSPLFLDRQGKANSAFTIYQHKGKTPGALVMILDVKSFLERTIFKYIPDGLVLRLEFQNIDKNSGSAIRGIPNEGIFILGNENSSSATVTNLKYNINFTGAQWNFIWDVFPHYQGGIGDRYSQPIFYSGSIASILLGILFVLLKAPKANANSRKNKIAEIDEIEKLRTSHNAYKFLTENMVMESKSSLEVLLGYQEMIGREFAKNSISDRIKKYFQGIVIGTNQINKNIHDILLITEINKSDALQETEAINLYQFCHDLENEFANSLAQGKITLEINAEKNLPNVMVNRIAFHRIAFNLLSTSVKYSPPDSKVTLRAYYDQPLIITQHTSSSRLSLILEIFDQGYGLPIKQNEINLDLIEGNNWTNHQAKDGFYDSGLLTAMNFCELLDIKLNIHTKPGIGARMLITLPYTILSRGKLSVASNLPEMIESNSINPNS